MYAEDVNFQVPAVFKVIVAGALNANCPVLTFRLYATPEPVLVKNVPYGIFIGIVQLSLPIDPLEIKTAVFVLEFCAGNPLYLSDMLASCTFS